MAAKFSNMGSENIDKSRKRLEPLDRNAGRAGLDGKDGLNGAQATTGSGGGGGLEFILDVPLEIAVELGRTKMFVNDLLKLGQGSVIELSKIAGETMDIMANHKLIARGEVVVSNEKYGVRLTEVVTPAERLERLK